MEPQLKQPPVQRCLEKLDKIENADLPGRPAAARELVQELIDSFGSPQLAAVALSVSPATLYRFRNGRISNRHLTRIRSVLTRPGAETPLQRTLSTHLPQHAGVHSIDFFYSRSVLAKDIFFFSSLLEFHAGDSEYFLRRTRELFEKNTELKMYLVFPTGSRAEETSNRFYELAQSFDEDWTSRIEKCPIADPDEMLSLGLGYSTQVALDYSAIGRRRFNKLLDVYVQLPLAEQSGDSSALVNRLVFCELPTPQAHELFARWKRFLAHRIPNPAPRPRSVA